MKSFDVAKMFMVFYSHYKTHMQQAYSMLLMPSIKSNLKVVHNT